MKFVVTARSVFENVYFVEAESQRQAEIMVESSHGAPMDFMQKHIEEKVISSKMIDDASDNEITNEYYEKGYF